MPPSPYRIVPTKNVALVRSLEDRILAGQYFEGPDAGNSYWLVKRGAVPVGYCSIRPSQFDPGATAFLSRCGVLPACRGKGLQRRCIRVRVAWARRHDYKRVITYVATDNIHSARNVIREGFEPWWPPASVGPWAGRDVAYFIKTL
jgi:GNAT superfamily N-acetyltransferase